MLRRFFLAVVLSACAGSAVAEIYRWTDDAGNVIFSDTPRPGAEVVELSEPTIVPAGPTDSGGSDKAQARPVARPYETLTITRPADETTLRNTRSVNVAVALQPRLQTEFGHRLQLMFNGQAVAPPGSALTFTLSDVDRGAHTLQAVIVEADGSVVERSETSQFFLQQPSVAN